MRQEKHGGRSKFRAPGEPGREQNALGVEMGTVLDAMLFIVVVLGIVEGLTEFLPVSSTGHLILFGHWLGFTGDKANTFEIVIQFGAILAVVWVYRQQLFENLFQLTRKASSQRYYLNILVGFVPAAILGFLFHDALKTYLFNPRSVAWALIAGALCIFLVERFPRAVRTRTVEQMGLGQSLSVGFAQCAALFPGFSRSAATILGGLVSGLDRPTAAQYSFLLAIPTILGATVLDLAKSYEDLHAQDLKWIALGFVISFFAAWAAVQWFLRFVSTHSLQVFAIYRLIVGIVVLTVLG